MASNSLGGSFKMDQRTPMSERQQLALLKKMEKSSMEGANGCANTSSSTSPDLASPPRTPLQVVNGPKSLRSLQSPGDAGDVSTGLMQSPRTPAEERIMRKILHKDSKGESYLHKAAIRGSSKLVLKLLKLKSDPNVTDFAGYTPLHEACNKGHLSVIKLLCEYGAQINTFGGEGELRETPLHDAAKNGHIKVVKYLLKKGADLGARKDNGKTPLDEVNSILVNCRDKEAHCKLSEVAELLEKHQENKGNISLSDTDQSETEDETNSKDLVRFLGISNSPSIEKVLQNYGVETSKSPGKSYRAKKKLPKRSKRSSSKFKSDDPSSKSSRARLSLSLEDKNEAKRKPRGDYSITDCDDTLDNHIKPFTQSPNDNQEKDPTKSTGSQKPEKSSTILHVQSNSQDQNVIPIRDKLPDMLKGDCKSSSSDNFDRCNERIGQETLSSEPKVPPLKIVLTNAAASEIRKKSCENDMAEHSTDIGSSPQDVEKEFRKSTEEKLQEGKLNERNAQRTKEPILVAKNNSEELHKDQQNSGLQDCQTGTSVEDFSVIPNYNKYHVKKRKLRSQLKQDSNFDAISPTKAIPKAEKDKTGASKQPLNDFQKRKMLQQQIDQKRKGLFEVKPNPPQGYGDYLINRKTYLLEGKQCPSLMPVNPPSSLEGSLRALFIEQEKERNELKRSHLVEKQKLVIAKEQEILRVHARAARELANQPMPFSACTILRDEEVYSFLNNKQEGNNREVRSRYNGRLFLSWLRDLDEKWEKIKVSMVRRHQHEAHTLQAVQKMNWEFEVNEKKSNKKTASNYSVPNADDFYVPIVHVSDDLNTS